MKCDIFNQPLHPPYPCILFGPSLLQSTILNPNTYPFTPSLMHQQQSSTILPCFYLHHMCFFTAWACWIKGPPKDPATLYTYYWWGDTRMRSLEEGNKRANKRIEIHQLKIIDATWRPWVGRTVLLRIQSSASLSSIPAGISTSPPGGGDASYASLQCLST